jgi:hypothetical protein
MRRRSRQRGIMDSWSWRSTRPLTGDPDTASPRTVTCDGSRLLAASTIDPAAVAEPRRLGVARVRPAAPAPHQDVISGATSATRPRPCQLRTSRAAHNPPVLELELPDDLRRDIARLTTSPTTPEMTASDMLSWRRTHPTAYDALLVPSEH